MSANEEQQQQQRRKEPETTVGLALQAAGIHSEDFRTSSERRAEAFIGWIKARPLSSVLISAVLGCVVGRTMGR